MCNTSLESLRIQLAKMVSFGCFASVPKNLRLDTHALLRISIYINKLCKRFSRNCTSEQHYKIHISGTHEDKILFFQHFNQKLLFISSNEKCTKQIFSPNSCFARAGHILCRDMLSIILSVVVEHKPNIANTQIPYNKR